MCTQINSISKILFAKGIFRLVPMLMSDNEELREAVNVAVANLTTDNSNNIE